MTAINFPASPSPGDKWPTTGNIDGKVWAWDGTTWKIVSTNGTVTIIDNTARSFAFTVTYTNVPGSYNVVGTDRNGEVNGLNPTITVNEEDTLIFNVNASGHPFYLVWQHGGSSNQVGGGQGTNTATNQGTVSGTVTWVTDVGDGLALPQGKLFYYQCGNHTNMYGTIKVLLKNTSDSASHIHDLIDLDDTPNAYDDGKYLKSNATGTEWATVTSGTTYGVVTDQEDGLAPQLPSTDANTKYLRGDGSWQVVSSGGADGNDYVTNLSLTGTTLKAEFSNSSLDKTVDLASIDTNTEYNVVSTSVNGLAPQLPVSHGGKFLKADGSWEVPSYSIIPGTFTTTAAGLVPITPGGTTKFLRADGQWQVPAGSGTGSGYGIAQILFESGPSGQISATAGQGSNASWIDVIDKDITLTDTNQVKIEVNGEPRLDGFRTMRYEIRLIRTTGGTATTLYEGHQGLSDSSDNYSTMNGVLWLESPGVGTHNYKYQFRQVISWNNSVAYVAADSMTMTLTEIAPGSGGGTSDGNDYVTNVSLGTGVNAKKLTLGFVNTSLNQTVDLASIDSNTEYNPFSGGGAGLVPDGSSAGSTKFLRSDGSWQTVSTADGNDYVTNLSLTGTTLKAEFSNSSLDQTIDLASIDSNTEYNPFSGGNAGLVPDGSSAGSTKFLRSDGSWQTVSTSSADGNDYVTGAALGTGVNAKKLTLSFGNTSLNQIVDLASIDSNTEYSPFSGGNAGLVPDGSSAGSTKFLRSDGSWQTVSTGGADGNDYVTNLSLTGTTLKAEFSNSSLDQTIDLASIDSNTEYSPFSGGNAGLVPNGSSAGSTKFLRSDGSWQTVAGEENQNAFSVISANGINVSADGKTDTATFIASGGMTITANSSSDEITFSSANTEYSPFSGGNAGLVPDGSSAGSTKFLRSDGTWRDVGGADGNDYVTNLSLSGTTLTATFSNSSLNQSVNLSSIDTNTEYSPFSGGSAGLVPNGSSAGSTKFLRSDGNWADVSAGNPSITTDSGNAWHNLIFVDSASAGQQQLKMDNQSSTLAWNPSTNTLIAAALQSYLMKDWNGSSGSSGDILTSQGSGQWSWETPSSGGGGVSNSKITTYTSGNGTHTTQSWCTTIIAALVGAGGGGGSAAAFYDDDDSPTVGRGGGGGSGGVSFFTASNSGAVGRSYSIGTGGTAQAGNCDDSPKNGNSGTGTGFGGVTAGGGGGGQGVGQSGNGSGGAAGSGHLAGRAGGTGMANANQTNSPFWGKYGTGGAGGDGTGLTGNDGLCNNGATSGENGALIILELG